MLERILVPLDGSELAEAVLPYVVQLAARGQASVTLFHVEPPIQDSHQSLEERLTKVAEGLSKQDVRTDVKVVAGYPAGEIVRFARTEAYSFIAMATHGRSGLNRWLYGSVAAEVVQTSDVPVLAVRPLADGEPPSSAAPIHHLVVPLDGSELAEEALLMADKLARRLGVGITLMRVIFLPPRPYSGIETYSYGYDAAYEYEKGLREALEAEATQYVNSVRAGLAARGLSAECVVTHGHPASQIITVAQTTPGCLVVMATHGRSGVQRWLLGSVADRVLRAARCPVLLVRPREARVAAMEAREPQTQKLSPSRK